MQAWSECTGHVEQATCSQPGADETIPVDDALADHHSAGEHDSLSTTGGNLMTGVAHQKVNAGHLKRNAYLYVRQSTLRQVFENTESTKRQYGLRQHAVALGWPVERIIVIDSDLGQSGASAVDREGFQKLVTEVSLGKAGIVLGLEVSRLARNSTDWHRLLEICALTDTLILDEDGVYDPSHFNDRLLLGLKGTMSEAELHVLRARLQGGILNKARRGELQCPLPVGFVYNVNNEPVLDPDKQVQESIRFFFETFRRTASACAVVKAFREKRLLFPRRLKKGPNKGDLVWAELPHSRALHILHNPVMRAHSYMAEAVLATTRTEAPPIPGCRASSGRCSRMLTPATSPGSNMRRTFCAFAKTLKPTEPIAARVLHARARVVARLGGLWRLREPDDGPIPRAPGPLVPEYVCQRDGIEHAISICQRVVGDQIDHAVGQLLVESVAPLALEVTLSVQQELQARIEEVDKLRKKQVERARYEADLAQRRYLHVDPANRLVADSLEADWNEKLRALTAAQEQYEQQRQKDRAAVNEQQRARIAALASDFPRLWQDPKTPDRERKRMVRLLLADVTLIRGNGITVHVRFSGGATKTLELPRPLTAWELRTTPAEIVAEIDRLTDHYTDKQIVEILNQPRGTVRMRATIQQPYHRASPLVNTSSNRDMIGYARRAC